MSVYTIHAARGRVCLRNSEPKRGATSETVVLLHSSASSGAQWRRLEGMLKADYRVVAPDLYGYGGSAAWPGPGPLTMADEARQIWDVIRRRNGAVHLVGHSYGGAVALRLALDHPYAFQSLTLIEPVAFHLLQGRDATVKHFLAEIRALSNSVCRGVAEGRPADAMAGFVDYWNGAGSWQVLSEERRAALAATAGKVAMDFFSSMTETRMLEAYRRILLPTQILVGDRSPPPVRYIAGRLGAVLPAAGVRHMTGLGHMMPLTHPEIVNPVIERHIRAHGRPRQAAA